MTTHTQEALKMFVRSLLAAIIPVLVDGLQNGMSWRDILVPLAIAALLGLDKWVHENPAIDANGISPI